MTQAESQTLPHQTVGTWTPAEMTADEERWHFPVPPQANTALLNLPGRELPQLGDSRQAVARHHHKAFSRRVHELLYDGPGVVLLEGAPVDSEEQATAWLWALGNTLGQPVPQNKAGDLIGRVEDVGADARIPTHRGHQTAAALPFHADRTDVIALLCVRTAVQGGSSQLAAAGRTYTVLAEEAPDSLAVLCQPFPQDRRGEEEPGESPYCMMPIFSTSGARLVCRYVRRFIESSQRHPEAPRLTAAQLQAMEVLDEVLTRSDVVLSMDLEPGQVQLIENHSILHARTAFTGNQSHGGRLLLRLWLSTERSPTLPEAFASLYGSVRSGTVRGGVWPSASPDLVGSAVGLS